MKQHHILSLLQNNYSTCRVVFPQPNERVTVDPVSANFIGTGRQTETIPKMQWGSVLHTNGAKTYTYKFLKTLQLVAGDKVIVDSPQNGLVIVTVVEINEIPKVDLDADFSYKWIVQRVDTSAYFEQLQAEDKFKETLNDIERERQREILLADFTNRMPEGSAARVLFNAAVSQFTALQPVQPPETKAE